MDLAAACRYHLYDRPQHKLLIRWGVLYPLYVICEIGIIFTDIAELLGSAIAINLLIPAIPLPVCVVLTAVDVLLILVLFNKVRPAPGISHYTALILSDLTVSRQSRVQVDEVLRMAHFWIDFDRSSQFHCLVD